MYWALYERFQKRFTTQHKIYWAIEVLSCFVHKHTHTHSADLFTHSFDEDDVRDRARDLNYQIINHFIRETTSKQTNNSATNKKEKQKQKLKLKLKQKETKCHLMEVFPRLITLHQIATDRGGERERERSISESEGMSEIDSQITMHAIPVRK